MDKKLEQILEALISIPNATHDKIQSKRAIAAVRDILTSRDTKLTEDSIGGFPYLGATTREPNDDTIWFVSHLDVVPAEVDMFKLRSDAKNYYGRGVFDMKGMAAAILAAFLQLPDPSKANVGLMFTTDEEVGGKSGVGALVDKNFKGAAAFVFDQSADWVMMEKMKGVLWLEVTANGSAAHGARPWLGHSANQDMVDFLHELKKWYNATMPQDDPDQYYTTFNLGTLHGGEATNQVNDKATATIDVRFVSEEDAAKVLDATKTLAKKFKSIEMKELMHEPCVNADQSEKWYRKTVELMQGLGIKPGPNGEALGHGSTDGRFFAPFNIPVITTRPPGGGQHGPEEWTSKQGLHDLERLCLELMKATI